MTDFAPGHGESEGNEMRTGRAERTTVKLEFRMTVWAPLPFGELIVELFPHFVDARLRRVANFPTSDEL